MCRFTVTSVPPPQPSSPDLEHLLDDDDFCWFDAIAEIPDLADDQGAVANVYPADAAAARSSESSETGQSDTKASPGAGNSDTSSYDLLELFKQQVEQEPAVMMAGGMQSQYAFTPLSANPAEQNDVAAGYPDAGLSMSTYAGTMGAPSALPVNMMPPAASPVIMPAAPSSYLPPAVTLAPAMPAPASAAPVVRKPGGRVQKTLEEQEAAIERIKQKRRESAQRSRARKNDYMRHLEIENQSLKEEVQRLQNMVQSMQRQSCMQPPQLLGQMVV